MDSIEQALHAGMALESFAKRNGVSVVFPVNVRGLVPRDAFTVRHNEAMGHVGAAGGEILAWAQHKGHSAALVYKQRNGKVGYAQGTPNELFAEPLRRLMEGEKAWSHGHGDSRGSRRAGNFRRDISQATFVRMSHEILRKLVRDYRISEPDAEELINRRSVDIEEMLSAKIKVADIARTLASTSGY